MENIFHIFESKYFFIASTSQNSSPFRVYFQNYLFIYLFERQSVRKRKRALLSAGSFCKWLCSQGWARPKPTARNPILASHVDSRNSNSRLCHCFSSACWVWTGVAGTQTRIPSGSLTSSSNNWILASLNFNTKFFLCLTNDKRRVQELSCFISSKKYMNQTFMELMSTQQKSRSTWNIRSVEFYIASVCRAKGMDLWETKKGY